MRKNLASPITNPFGGNPIASFEVSDHRVEVLQSYQPAVPEVVANPQATPPVAGSPAVSAVQAKSTINSQVAFYDANGIQLSAQRDRLTDAQFTAWDNSVADDDLYFLACHAERRNLAIAQ